MSKFKVLLAFSCMMMTASLLFAQEEEKKTTPATGQVLDRIVAKVNNYILLESDVQKTYLEAIASSQQGFEAPTRCDIFESMLINKLMVAKAEIDSVVVSDAEVMIQADQRFNMMMAQLGGDENTLVEVYGKTSEQLKSEITDALREQMIVQRMQGKITEGLTVSPAEVRRFFNSIPKDSLPFFSAEVTVGQIVRKPEVNEKAKTEVANFLSGLKQQLMDGTSDFATLARQYSQDPGSAIQGGELGFFRRGELAPEYEATSLALKPGEISDPVETMFGFHMIQLLERRGNTFNTRHILIKPEPSEDDIKRTERYLDSLRNVILDGKIEFAKAAKEYSEDRETSDNGGFFADPGSGSNRLTLRTLDDPVLYFTLDSMKIGSITPPMRFEDPREGTKVRVLFYKERFPAHRANLNDDYEKLKAATRRKKEDELLGKWFVTAKEDVYIDIDPAYDRCNVLQDK
ncbi:peptidylprolyl isomerase [Belliella pelovolcani]|uniref:Periplasmic chaperone for outer membrane proteins SurA n=1 Tax=Belliella pelovolcani TaxID=529505 RepID=A0A1N7JU42_9BACT|nr:peptidylprolyl isomerase [Belliella pelovolcani]SIS52847.1 periplasmic chaperone for outer membrane proteins SurA [Belliella pelovolcani]